MHFLRNHIPEPETSNFVYGLCDPDTNELRYIGITSIGFKRFLNHYNDCLVSYKHSAAKKWVKSLRDENKVFSVIYIEYFNEDGLHLDEAEIFWIQYFRSIGCNLLNHEKGGRILSDLQGYKKRKSRSLRGVRKTKAHAEKIKKAQTEMYGLKIKDDLGNVFNSLKEAADFYGSKKSTIQKAVYGSIKVHKGRTFTRISGGRKTESEIKINRYIKKGRTPNKCEIIDNNGIIYLNASDASRKLGLKKRQIFRLLSGECLKTKNGITLKRM